jgi:hypothetical protein
LKIAFQADSDLHPAIRSGVRRREPLVDFRSAAGVLADGTPDLEVLRIAAEDGRVLVSKDVRTMFGHFDTFLQASESPGVLLIPSSRSIGEAIESILHIWTSSTPKDLRNRIQFLPSVPVPDE